MNEKFDKHLDGGFEESEIFRKHEKLREYKDRIGQLELNVFENASEDESENFYRKLQDKKKSLIEKYGSDANLYILFHALGGSSIMRKDENHIIADDFPGDDSVAQFIEKLEEEYIN